MQTIASGPLSLPERATARADGPPALHRAARLLLLSPLYFLLSLSCTPRNTPEPYTGPTQPMLDVVAAINANNRQLKTLWGQHDFDATLREPSGKTHNFSGTGLIMHRQPADLLLTGKGIIPFFEIGSNARNYWFSALPDEISTRWWGNWSSAASAGLQDVPIRPDLVLEVLGVGEISTNFLDPPLPVMRFNNDADAYMFVWTRPAENRWVAEKEVWYDRKTKLPRLVLIFDPSGRVVLRAYLSDHKPVAGTEGKMATRYDLYFPDTKSRLTFHLTDIRATFKNMPNDRNFRFPAPEESGARKQIEIK